jgi:hypothetical protein
MVPYYPNLGDLSDEKNQYQRDVLYMVSRVAKHI